MRVREGAVEVETRGTGETGEPTQPTRDTDSPTFKHGLNGYKRHKCRCDICKAARAEARQEEIWRARHRKRIASGK